MPSTPIFTSAASTGLGAGLLSGMILLGGCTTPAPPAASPVDIEGKAALDAAGGSRAAAQRLAVEDGYRQALDYNADVSSARGTTPDGRVLSATQVRSSPAGLVSESLQITPADGRAYGQAERALGCGRSGQSYRKKLAMGSFQLLHRDDSKDVAGINDGYATALARSLAKTGQFVIRDTEKTSIFEFPTQAPRPNGYETQENNVVIDLADSVDAQFVVGGIIHDMKIHTSGVVDALSSLTEYLINVPPHTRSLDVELFIYDGQTGLLLDRFALSDTAHGTVYFAPGTYFDSSDFTESAIGQTIADMIEHQTQHIVDRLRCLPVSEHILQVDGQTLYINAGASQNIRVGDELVVYGRSRSGITNLYYQNTHVRGSVESPIGVVTIHQVQPMFSVGTLDVKNTGQISPMDHVRAW